jgi:hypothetical protein
MTISADVPTDTAAVSQGAEWIELFPSGVSFGTGEGRPVLILKDKFQVEVLPVWMHPLDAAVSMSELSTGSGATPHAIVRRILEQLSAKVEACRFQELIGHHQYVEIEIQGLLKPIRVRADEAMSFCLETKAKFLATRDYMARCRDLDQELQGLESDLNGGALAALQSERENVSKKHPYVM